ncbi:hypothetical protein BDN70DRAFT_988158 [Pholiota conissans]|uniref:receptor protein-tyrosine kinase n=1 Tax=Pholiota conissans TaxID=109636 RepID=A0A9P6D7V8_9AGAR|nr:hypothetical protein BDN70DRAFT_988158 [Pholiota conissans]
MTLSLRANLEVDDTDSHFAYGGGDWQEQTGSTRQFNGNVHVTNTVGATVSFRYNGQAFALVGTTPAGGGNVVVDISIDGGAATTVTVPCDQTSNQYAVDFFESPVVSFAVHTVVITNRGSQSFMFDSVKLYSDDINPTMASPPASPPTTSSTSTTSRRTTTAANVQSPTTDTSTTHTSQTTSSTTPTISPTGTSGSQTSTDSHTVPTSLSSSSTSSSSSSHTVSTSKSTTTFLTTDAQGSTVLFTQTFTTSLVSQTDTVAAAAVQNPSHIGTILAGVFGGLAFLLLLVVAFLFLRRRKARRKARARLEEDERGLVLKKPRTGRALTVPQPFRLSTGPNPSSPEDDSPTSGNGGPTLLMSEKTGHRIYNTRPSNQAQSSEQGPSSSSPPSSSSSSGHSFSDQLVTHAPSSRNLNRGFSSAAQPDPASDTLHRRSASVANIADRDRDGGARPSSPTMSSMYMPSTAGGTDEAPPAYQPPATGNRVSDFKTRSQLYDDHSSSRSPEDE